MMLLALKFLTFGSYQLYFDLFVLFLLVIVLLYTTKDNADRMNVINDLKLLIILDAVHLAIMMVQNGLTINKDVVNNRFVYETIELLVFCILIIYFIYINKKDS